MNIDPSIKNIAILLNPSLSRKVLGIASFLRQRLDRLQIGYTVFQVWPEYVSDFTDVWIAGGDGTLHYALNKYRSISQSFAVFKGGTGNDFAWQLYADASNEEIIEIALMSEPKTVDILSCNDRLYANSGGFGFDGEVLKSMKAIRTLGGHLGYYMATLKAIFLFREFRFSIIADNAKFEDHFLIVAANNSRRTGGGFLVTPHADISDGKIDMVLCKKLSVVQRLRNLPLVSAGKHTGLPFVTYIAATAIDIKCNREIHAQIDGELISGKQFSIKILPGYSKFRYQPCGSTGP